MDIQNASLDLEGAKLVNQVVCDCFICRVKSAKMCKQRMGSFLEERINPNTKLFTAIWLDMLGTTIVKYMTNKRANMKVWPISFFSQATDALHTQFAHYYGKKEFILHIDHFVAIHDSPLKVASDEGSQLTSASPFVTWTEKES